MDQVKISVHKDGYYYLEEGMLELYVKQTYVDRGHAKVMATRAESIGILPMKWYKSPNSEKPTEERTWNSPTQVVFYPSDTRIQKVQVYPESEPDDYTILKFLKGDKIMLESIIQNLDNVVEFAQMMLGGVFDTNIPYKLWTPAWINNIIMNDVNLAVPVTNIDSIVASLCRYKGDVNRSFASVYGKNPKISQYDYQFANIRSLCATDSIFGALSFEDMNSMLDSSLNMTSEEREQRISPVESIIKL